MDGFDLLIPGFMLRVIGGFGPVVIGIIAVAHGFETANALLAVLYGLDILAMWLLIPERKGMPLT